MQEYRVISITKEEILPLARRMRESGTVLAMIHGYPDENGLPVISYEFENGADIDSYTVRGERILPSISGIYDMAAEWPERELMELMDVIFEGIDRSKRLFLPESMFEEQGQILVTPMRELKKTQQPTKEDAGK